MSPAWLSAGTAVAVAVAGLLAWGVGIAFRLIKRTMHFLDDHFGEPARPGVPERPGVMARLESLTGDVSLIKGQVFPNGGSSLRDTVQQTALDVAGMRARMELFEVQRETTGPAIKQVSEDVADMRGRMELFETERADREDE